MLIRRDGCAAGIDVFTLPQPLFMVPRPRRASFQKEKDHIPKMPRKYPQPMAELLPIPTYLWEHTLEKR